MAYTSFSTSLKPRARASQYTHQIESRLDQLLPGCSAALAQACREAPDLVPYRVRQALNRALTPALIPQVTAALLNLPRAEQTYSRHVLHADPQGRLTVVALVWAPGQFSPVHAHYTWCAYRVLSGVLSETHYAWDPSAGHAYPFNSIARPAGQSVCGHAGLELIHRLGNASHDDPVPAVSLHVYGIDSERVSTHVNRVLASVQRVS
jgi:predicted metal-dependent enzyme (double-stranded beta helix superfamily)